MTWTDFNTIALPIFGGFVAIATVVVPIARLRMRAGIWPFGQGARGEPLLQYVEAGLALSVGFYGAWMACHLFAATRATAWAAPSICRAAGWAIAVAGLAVIVTAQAQMRSSWRIGIEPKPTLLVRTGLFRWTRHPIYTGWAAILIGVMMASPGAWTTMGLVWTLTLLGMQARLEERHLLGIHGDEYRAYASRVGRFLPWIGRMRPSAPTQG